MERELCPAFLIEDFTAASGEAERAVRRLCEVVSTATSRLTAEQSIDGAPVRGWLERRPEWEQAQRAIQWQFRARAALELTGLPLPPDARARSERAQADFAALGLRWRSAQ